MTSSRTLVLEFARRMADDLDTNNVLRGSWAEQLVAHFLEVEEMPPNWTYFDLCDLDDREISVKHSAGPRPSFSVGMSSWAWHPADGWFGADGSPPQYWCHAYVFAWLEAETSTPDLDKVLDPDLWRFAVLSRAEMYGRFVGGRDLPQKTTSISTLNAVTEFVPGSQLHELVAAVPVVDDPSIDGVPVRNLQRYGVDPGPPVRPVGDVVPDQALPDDTEV